MLRVVVIDPGHSFHRNSSIEVFRFPIMVKSIRISEHFFLLGAEEHNCFTVKDLSSRKMSVLLSFLDYQIKLSMLLLVI